MAFKVDDHVVIRTDDEIFDNLLGTIIDVKVPEFGTMSTRYRVKFDAPVAIDGKIYESDQFLEHELTLSIKFSHSDVPSGDLASHRKDDDTLYRTELIRTTAPELPIEDPYVNLFKEN